MICSVMPMAAFIADQSLALDVAERLTRPASAFQDQIKSFLARSAAPVADDGTISVVRTRHGLAIGWARSERWCEERMEPDGHICRRMWNTLEAFVDPEWRNRGVATFAAAGLMLASDAPTSALPSHAVFRPSMLLVARRIGIRPILFQKDAAGRLVRA